ncbi:MAG: ABC transporter ATP-binding protein [Anaerolineae bacterium]|jgi:ABC-type lipoprotein export system ATPase subunit|nr:ABC transporter ATP-binding protein [Anaerolineae bacterium]
MTSTWIIETQDLTKIYGDGTQIRALDGVNIQIASGEFVAVMGPSGSGKSTLLNMLGALDRPTTGHVLVGGQDLSAVRDLDSFRARTVGFVFQLHNLIPTLNALENIEVPMIGQSLSPVARRHRAEELLALVGLRERMHHLPNQLSGGQRQRIAIARSLANKPALVLADEPTGNLDSQSGAEIITLMRRLNRELGTTFVVVTHDLVVARQTDRVLVMHDGKIVNDHRIGSPVEEDLKAFRDSGFGKAIVAGDEATLEPIGITSEEWSVLQRLLTR